MGQRQPGGSGEGTGPIIPSPTRTLAEGEQEEVEAEADEEGAHGPLPPAEGRDGEGRDAPGTLPVPARTYRRRERTPSAASRSGSK